MFFSAILFNLAEKRAIGSSPPFILKLRDFEALPTRLLEGLPICSVQPPMLHSFFNNRVVALYKYWIMITATEILVDPPSVIQI